MNEMFKVVLWTCWLLAWVGIIYGVLSKTKQLIFGFGIAMLWISLILFVTNYYLGGVKFI